MQNIYFSAGSFHKLQFLFDQFQGIENTEVGFMILDNLKQSEEKNSVETLKVTFDPSTIKYKTVLDFFWQIVLVVNNELQDQDTQITIFFTNSIEKSIIKLSQLEHQRNFNIQNRVQILPVQRFKKAAENQQKFYQKMGLLGTITLEEQRGISRKIQGFDQFE